MSDSLAARAIREQMGQRTTHRRRKPKPNPNAPLGQGGRFAALEQKLAKRPGVHDPGALAAYIGRQKYGAKRFAALSRGGR